MRVELGALLLVLLGVYGFLWILDYYCSRDIDPREPPIVRSKIPLFGHVIGLLRHGTAYYVQLHSQTSLPAYTLRFCTQKVYVLNSLPLISAVHRNAKTLTFDPLVKLAAERLSGLDTTRLGAFDGGENNGGDNLSTATLKGIARALSPGPDVIELNLGMLSNLQDSINEAQNFREPRLFLAWIQHVITQASTNAIYGSANPFVAQELEDAFWTFENNAAPMLLGFAPRLIARKATKARDKLTHSIHDYYNSGGHKQASSLACARMAAPLGHNFTLLDVAKLEVPFLIAILANTVPTTFWLLSHIYACHSLLSDVRAEVAEAVTSNTIDSRTTFTIDLSLLQAACPLLLAVYHEILRVYSVFPIVRAVTTDTLLNETHLLKKDTFVMIPSGVVHADPSNWGLDAQSIDPYRWIRKDQAGRPRPGALAFRAFGGAPNLCPGRHFATTEILATVAALVLRYEVVPEGGVWTVPKQDFSVFAAVPPPKGDVRVAFQVREQWRGEWKFETRDANVRFGLASG